MHGTRIAATLMLIALAAAGGCSTTLAAPGHGTRASLVVPPTTGDQRAGLRADPGAWEFGRNDDRLNAGREPYINADGWAELRTRARLRTSNGLPREHSSADIRTFQRRRLR